MSDSGIDALLSPPTVKLLVLLKVGREDHMHALRDGKLFCRRLSFYSEIEGDPLPHQDAHEGLAGVYQSDRVEITYKAANAEPIVINAASGLIDSVLVSIKHDNPVLCLHAIHTENWTHRIFGDDELDAYKAALQVPESMDKFGTHVWLITKGEEFMKRLLVACEAHGIGCRGSRVQYVDPSSIHGSLPRKLLGFVKLNSFAEEREYRFIFESAHELPDPFILDLGSLHDISEVTTLAEFRRGWSIDFQQPENRGRDDRDP